MTIAILQTLGLLVLAGLTARAGMRLSRMKRFWLYGFCIPFVFVVMVVLFNRSPRLASRVPLAWLGKGRTEFILMSLCVPLLFGTLIPRLPKRRQKYFLSVLATAMVLYYTLPPFLEPALFRSRLEKLETWMEDGVCLQTTCYTCGPAAAVTALAQFDIPAEESSLAIEAKTSRRFGTSTEPLMAAIKRLYGQQGIQCRYRHFDSIEQMKDVCPVIAQVKYRFMVDHYLCVLEVHEDSVVVGDPLSGKADLAYEEFAEKWRNVGIVVQKKRFD